MVSLVHYDFNWMSLSCGQNKTFKHVILGCGKQFLWRFIDQTAAPFIKKINNSLTDNEKNSSLQPWSKNTATDNCPEV